MAVADSGHCRPLWGDGLPGLPHWSGWPCRADALGYPRMVMPAMVSGRKGKWCVVGGMEW